LKAEVERNEAISKILEVLVSVQFQASAVLAKVHELEIEKHNLTKKIMDIENWSKTESQYELKEVASGIFVYAYKKGNNETEPAHWLCTNCWKDKITSILQRSASYPAFTCPKCKTKFDLSWDSKSDFSSGAIIR
jgi:hypothetical protein